MPNTMSAVLLIGHGGLDKLEYRSDVAVPRPRVGEGRGGTATSLELPD